MKKSNNPRLLIAKLRKGDYAHAGEEEAIDIVTSDIKELISKSSSNNDKKEIKLKAIDIGCGLGGTANYFKNRTGYDVYGVDIDQAVIQHARDKYKNIKFFNCNVLDVKNELCDERFDLVYMFNSFYAFENQLEALKVLADITKQNGLLVIFDYSIEIEDESFNLLDLAGRKMHPIYTGSIENTLNSSGWKLIRVVNLHEKFEDWYSSVVDRLHKNKIELLNEFTEESYAIVEKTFIKILDNIKNKILSGSIVYASKIL